MKDQGEPETAELMTEYARLLRMFYGNPSNPWVRRQVVAFEQAWSRRLAVRWQDWQERANEGHGGATLDHTCICQGFYRNRYCTALEHR